MRSAVNVLVLMSLVFSTSALSAPTGPFFDPNLKLPGLPANLKNNFVLNIRDAAKNAVDVYADKAGLNLKNNTKMPVPLFQCVCFTLASGMARAGSWPIAIQQELEEGRKNWCDDENGGDPTKGKAVVLAALAAQSAKGGGGGAVNKSLQDANKQLVKTKPDTNWTPVQVAAVGVVVLYILADEMVGVTSFVFP